jgi:uncharacterized protein (TIGR03083 family)
MTDIDHGVAAEQYRLARERMSDLVAGAGEDIAATRVGACPAWNVKDLFSHVTGIAVDLAAGNRPQGDAQVWVDRQVAERSAASLFDVITEWTAVAPTFESMIEARPDRLWGLTYDLVVHEHDLRTALGDRSDRATDGVALAARLGLRLAAMDLNARNFPGVRVVIDGEPFVVGERDPVATVSGSAFDVLRLLGSRRTIEEIRAAHIEGDLDAVLGGFLHMDPPVVSLGE